MTRVMACVSAALLTSLFSFPAFAATCGNSGGPGVWIDLNVAGATCAGTGNGLVLDTGSDPFGPNLDTTKSGDNRTPALTVNFSPISLTTGFQTDGTFSFNPAGLTSLKIGFQLNTNTILGFDPDPDWFVFNLPVGAGNGAFDADFALTANGFELPSDPIKYAVLYGTLGGNQGGETPLPGAVWLLGSVLGGGIGIRKWRNRKAKA